MVDLDSEARGPEFLGLGQAAGQPFATHLSLSRKFGLGGSCFRQVRFVCVRVCVCVRAGTVPAAFSIE